MKQQRDQNMELDRLCVQLCSVATDDAEHPVARDDAEHSWGIKSNMGIPAGMLNGL